MPDYYFPVSDRSQIYLYDDGYNSVHAYLTVNGGASAYKDQLPWASTVDGVRSSWKTFQVYEGSYWNWMGTVYVGTSQTVTFHLGETEYGGPADASIFVHRGALFGSVRIFDGQTIRRAIPYVNVNGVWRLAEPWNKHVGTWKQTN